MLALCTRLFSGLRDGSDAAFHRICFYRGVVKQVDVVCIPELPVAGVSCEFVQDAGMHQPVHEGVGRRICCPVQCAYIIYRDDRPFEQQFQCPEPVAGGAAEGLHDDTAVLLPQVKDMSGRIGGLRTDFNNAAQEKNKPLLPASIVADRLQFVIVLLPVFLEEMGQVQNGFLQHFALAKQKGNEQPSDAAVAVKKRVDGLELCMRETNFDQKRQIILAVDETFPVREVFAHPMGRGWNEDSLSECASGRADPVLSGPQFAGCERGATDAAQEFRVDFAHQTNRYREIGQALQAVIHCPDTVHDLFYIPWSVG